MAIRGTLTHRKTRRLAKLMNIAQPFALGLMEALWHVTAEQAPTGAIGRLSNKDIADEMFWDEDPDVLIQAFIDAGLIDKHPQFRLIIHDWQSHADQATKRKLARHGKTFADGDDECLVMTSQGEAMTGLPVPVPESSASNQSQKPEPVNNPSTPQGGEGSSKKKRDPARKWGQVFEELKELLPESHHASVKDWCVYAKEKKYSAWVPETVKRNAKDWKDWPAERLSAMIDYTIRQSWQGLQEPKSSAYAKPGHKNGKPTEKLDWTEEDLDRINNPWKYENEGQN